MADILAMRNDADERAREENSAEPSFPPNVSAVIGDLITDARKLVRQEAALIRADLRGTVESKSSRWLVWGIGSALVAFGMLGVLAALIGWLHEKQQVPFWMSAAGVGGAALILGAFIIFLVGKRSAHE